MDGFFYQGIWRMDWGLDNPNKTAALIAELILLSWGFAYWKRWGFWLSSFLSVALGVCLIMTYSRGGLGAAMCGLGVLLAFAQRPWPKFRIVTVLILVLLLGSFAFQQKATSRYVQGLGEEDLSISNRLAIWKMAPRMMLDAPSGWGLGRSGNAYMQWYQPVKRSEQYRTLVNNHLTWLVEFGWPMRFVYLVAWFGALTLCWPNNSCRWFSIPLGIWLVFAVGTFFSSVAESLMLWIVPVLALVAALVTRFFKGSWPPVFHWKMMVGSSALILLALILWGWLTPGEFAIQGSPAAARVFFRSAAHGGNQEIWIVAPDKKTLGEHYGHAIRKALAPAGRGAMSVVNVVSSVKNLPDATSGVLVLTGDFSSALPLNFSKLVLLNPMKSPDAMVALKNLKRPLIIIWGEFRRRHDREAWESWAGNRGGVNFVEAPGAAEYLGDWMDLILVSDSR